MDFPSILCPTLFTTGPLGQSDVPDMSFMCSWRDMLTLPEPLPQISEVRMVGRAWQWLLHWLSFHSIHISWQEYGVGWQ